MISTYAELKTAVANWLHDSSTYTSRIPEFIQGAESIVNYGIELPNGMRIDRVRCGDNEVRATATIDAEYEDLPTNLLEPINIQLNTNPKTSLEYLSPEQIDQRQMGSTTEKPIAYTMIGNQFQFAPAPDASYTAEIAYIKKYAAFSADGDTNFILTEHPFVYLYAALAKAKEFKEDDSRYNADSYYARYAALVNGINRSEALKKTSTSSVRARPRAIA